jgi:hypothetical protein
MKRYFISNDDYNYSFLHTNGHFYNCIIDMKGCKIVSYKNLKSARKKANSLLCAYVVEVEIGQTLREGKIVA